VEVCVGEGTGVAVASGAEVGAAGVAVVSTIPVGSAPDAAVADGDAGAGLQAARKRTRKKAGIRRGEAPPDTGFFLTLFRIRHKIELQ
jgi:hypothetical protein